MGMPRCGIGTENGMHLSDAIFRKESITFGIILKVETT